MVCVGCNKRNSVCSKGCLDYLLESLVQPKEMKINDYYKLYKDTSMKKWRDNHTCLGGK